MTIDEYKWKVKELLQSPQTTEEVWNEVLEAVLESSKSGWTPIIDKIVGLEEE